MPVEAKRLAARAAAEILARRRALPRAVVEESCDPAAEIGERSFCTLVAIAADTLGRLRLRGEIFDGTCFLPVHEEERVVRHVVGRAIRGTRVRRAHPAFIEVACVEKPDGKQRVTRRGDTTA